MLNLKLCILVVFCSLAFIGCKADSNTFASSNSSIGSGDGSAVDATAGFRVSVRPKTGVDSFLHRFGDTTALCEVPLSSIDTPTDVQCMLNMMEYDLWFYGYEYELSVPANVCKFVTDTPMYQYKLLPGRGPQVGTITTLDGAITACTIDSVATGFTAGACVGAEGMITPTGTIECAYDYATTNPETTPVLPNCCIGRGEVVVTATVTPATGSPTTTTSVVETEYGGKISNCVESAHDYITTWPKDAETGGARSVIYELSSSPLFRSTKVPSTFSTFNAGQRPGSLGNFLNAGFHDWGTYATDPSTFDTNRSIARAFRPNFDRGVNNNHATNAAPLLAATALSSVGDGSQEFRCLTSAGELKHRIRLYVNEWNTIEAYDEYKENGDPTAVAPTVTGLAGVNCAAVNLGQTCNSVWGFDDMLTNAGLGELAYVFPRTYEALTPP